MELEPAHRHLALELKALQDDFHAMDLSAREIETHGYGALLGDAAFARRAHENANRAVRLFDRAAHILRSVDEARHLRWRLVQTSEHLVALFPGDTTAPQTRHRYAFGAQLRKPTLWDLLYVANRRSPFYGGMSLHEQVLSVAEAACGALDAGRPRPR